MTGLTPDWQYEQSRLAHMPFIPSGDDPFRDAAKITVDITAFDPTKHYPNGVLFPGIVLGKITASGMFGPYDPAASDGRQTAVGINLGYPLVVSDRGTAATALVQIMITGTVMPQNLPANNGLDTAARTALRNIAFIDI